MEPMRTSDATAIAFQKSSLASSGCTGGGGAFFTCRLSYALELWNLCLVLPQHNRLINRCNCKGAKISQESGSILNMREGNRYFLLFIWFVCFFLNGLKNKRQFLMGLKMMSRNSIKTDQWTKSNRTYLSCK